MNRFKPVVPISHLLTLFLFLSAMFGCSTTTRKVTVDTGKQREVKIQTAYHIALEKPAPNDHRLKFYLIREEMFRREKQVKHSTIEDSEPDKLAKLILLPVAISSLIVTFGELDVYESLESESVLESESSWVAENGKTPPIRTPVPGAELHITYRYADEQARQILETDREGMVSYSLAELAESITFDRFSDEYVEFVITAPRYGCRQNIRIKRKEFVEIYKRLSEEGYKFQSIFSTYRHCAVLNRPGLAP